MQFPGIVIDSESFIDPANGDICVSQPQDSSI